MTSRAHIEKRCQQANASLSKIRSISKFSAIKSVRFLQSIVAFVYLLTSLYKGLSHTERKKMSGEYSRFCQEALDVYTEWMNEEHSMKIKLQDPPEYPAFTKMLAGSIDAIAEAKKSKGSAQQWPVVVKHIYQNPSSKAKNVVDIIKTRKNFYIISDDNEKTTDGDASGSDAVKWTLRKFSIVYYMCQNILKLSGYKYLDLVVFNPRNKDILVIRVPFEKQAFEQEFTKLQTHVSSTN